MLIDNPIPDYRIKAVYPEKEGLIILRLLDWMRENGITSVDDIIDEMKHRIGFRPTNYGKYLWSHEWMMLKKKVFERDGRRCCICGKTKGLNVHHMSYQDGVLENGDNLVVLCEECHQKVHEICKRMEAVYEEQYDKTRNELGERMSELINEMYPEGIKGSVKISAVRIIRDTVDGLLSHRGRIFEVRPHFHMLASLIYKEKKQTHRPRRKPKIGSALSMSEIFKEQQQV